MGVMIVMGNQDLSVIWNILKMLNIFMRTLYLMLSPLIMVKIILMMKVMNLFCKEGTSQIMIRPVQCMLAFQNINSKILTLISSRKVL